MLRKIITAAITFCLAFCNLTGLSADAEENYEIRKSERHEPKSLLILGDSIASGYGLDGYTAGENNSPDSFGSKLCEKYELTNDTYRNFAVDGLTSTDLLDSLQSGIYDDYLSCELIVISIGGNDLLEVLTDDEVGLGSAIDLTKLQTGELDLMQIIMNTDFDALAESVSAAAEQARELYRQNLAECISYINKISPDTQIVMLTLYNPMNTGIELLDSLYESNITALNDIIKSSGGYYTADVYEQFAAAEGNVIQSDYTHPNKDGHTLIFAAVTKSIIENCTFYDEYKVSKTIVEVTPEKSHLDLYLAAMAVFGVLLVIVLIVGLIRFIKSKKRKG